MKEYVKAVRHDTLRAIENAERLVAALGEADGAGTDKLRKASKRFAKHLKQELAEWEDKYKKARGKEAAEPKAKEPARAKSKEAAAAPATSAS